MTYSESKRTSKGDLVALAQRAGESIDSVASTFSRPKPATKKAYSCKVVWQEKNSKGEVLQKSFACLDKPLAMWHIKQMQKMPGVIFNAKVENL